MKRFILFLATCFSCALCLCAQECAIRYNSNIHGYGIYNERTNTWIVSGSYEGGKNLFHYSGVTYFGLKKNGEWAIWSSKGLQLTNFEFQDVREIYSDLGIVAVKRKGSWGALIVPELLYLYPCSYKDIGYHYFVTWSGRSEQISSETWITIRSKAINDAKKRKEHLQKIEEEARTRKKKEQELSSFTTYVKAYVEPRVNEWQKKGEYETTREYSIRVTGPNRTFFVDSLQIAAEKSFILEHTNMHPEKELMTVGLYDADNQVFPIQSTKFGLLLLNVPRSEAPVFKDNFSKVTREDPVLYIDEDKIALRSLVFNNPVNGKKYLFRNDDALEYKKVEIDPDTYEFNVVSVSRNVATSGAQSYAGIKKPTIKIISPENGTTYSTPIVSFQYETTTSSGTEPILHVWINGNEVSDFSSGQSTVSKGVKAAWKRISLVLPTDSSKPCRVMFSVIDSNGIPSENKVIALNYVGEIHKPTLHLLSVGISDYPSSSLAKLNYAAKDAKDFISVIEKSNLDIYGGLKTELINDKKATRANIERSLSNLVKNVNQGDVVILFFSGHGVRDGGNAYYMSYDADGNEPYTGVDFAMINRNLIKLKDKQCKVVLFMDACHSGMLYGGKGLQNEITFAEPGIIGFYSSTASQESAEAKSDENGIFTKAVLDGLKGGAKNKSGEITTLTLQNYINEKVKSASKGMQSPIVENNLGELTLFKVK